MQKSTKTTLPQIAQPFRHLAKRLRKMREAFAKRQNGLANCKKLSPNGKTASQIARSFRQMAKRLRKLQEAFAKWQNGYANCGKLSPSKITLKIKEL